jgi:hypothetical protein
MQRVDQEIKIIDLATPLGGVRWRAHLEAKGVALSVESSMNTVTGAAPSGYILRVLPSVGSAVCASEQASPWPCRVAYQHCRANSGRACSHYRCTWRAVGVSYATYVPSIAVQACRFSHGVWQACRAAVAQSAYKKCVCPNACFERLMTQSRYEVNLKCQGTRGR